MGYKGLLAYLLSPPDPPSKKLDHANLHGMAAECLGMGCKVTSGL